LHRNLPKYCAALVLNNRYWREKNLIFFNKIIYELNKKEFINKNLKIKKLYTKNLSKTYLNNLNNFVLKKFYSYKKQLILKLNKYHNLSESDVYWGKIIDIWLIEIIFILKLRYDEMKNYNKNSFYIYSNEDNFELPFSSNSIYTKCSFSSDLNQFIYVKIAEILKIPIKKIIENYNDPIVTKNAEAINFNKLFYYFFLNYVKLLKPIVLIDSYFNWREKIKIFILSVGRIIFVKSNNFFYTKKNKIIINSQYRSTLKLKAKDDFDKLFNSTIQFFFPISFLEGFKFIRRSISNYSVNIKKIGSAICSFCNDSYNILVAEMYKNKKKSILFAHGESDCIRIFDIRNSLAIKNSDLHVNYGDKNGYGISNLRRLNNFFEYKKNYVLFISQNSLIHRINNLPAVSNFEDCMEKNISFYKNLNRNIKSKFILRISPSDYKYENKSIIAYNIIKNKFKDAIIDSRTDIKKLFSRSAVVISTYISTNVFESLYIDKPTIIITDLNKYNFNSKAYLFFRTLQQAGLIYDDPKKAALFLNKNISNINLWWQSEKIRKILLVFKSDYCVDNKNFAQLLIKNLL
jgi:putative transferase (TIGR04331 family)